MTSKYRRHFTKKQSEYILRVAGKVPAQVIADTLSREIKSIYDFCERRQVSLIVPYSRLRKFWPDYVPDYNRRNG